MNGLVGGPLLVAGLQARPPAPLKSGPAKNVLREIGWTHWQCLYADK